MSMLTVLRSALSATRPRVPALTRAVSVPGHVPNWTLQCDSMRLRTLAAGGAAILVPATIVKQVCLAEEAAQTGKPKADDSMVQSLEQGPGKYVVYARRAVQAFLTKGRLVAYTSDVGESVRPVVPPAVVRLCYGLTWGYVGVDVAYHTFEEQQKGSPPAIVARTAAHATTFQVIASVAVPAFIIHQAVHLAQVALKSAPASPIVRWAPSLFGLALIPLLPYVDEPVEKLIDMGFEMAWPVEGPKSHAS